MKKLLLEILLILLLPGCLRFKPAYLQKQTYTHTTGMFNSPIIEATAKRIHDTDLSPTAGTITQHLEFITLTIKNKTGASYYIKSSSCSPLPISRPQLTALIPKSYGCYFIPATVLGFGGLLFLWQIGLPLAGLFTLFGIDQSRRAADRTLTSLTTHLFDSTRNVTLHPYTTTTVLLAIRKKDYTPQFSFSLRKAGSNEEDAICSVPLIKNIDTSYTLI
jgi:hypothetical protein